MTRLGRIAAGLAGIAAAALLVAPAQAREPYAAHVGGSVCDDRGITQYYVHHWQRIPIQKILDSRMVFGEKKCVVHGFRLYKSTSNTVQEARFARHFLATDRPKKPTIYCRLAPDHAYFLDLAFYWGLYHADHLNSAEQHHYTRWAHDYARRHDCRLFLPNRA